MSQPMRVKFNMITWLGHAIKWMVFTTSCAFTFLYFVGAFNTNPEWPWYIQIMAPLFFAVFGLCVADVGAFYWFNVWVGEVETPMQKTVAGIMTALTGLVAISTTILGMLNSLTTLADITATVKLWVTVITTVLIVIQLIANYGMSYFSRDSYIKAAITEAFLETFENDIGAAAQEALTQLKVSKPIAPALPKPQGQQARPALGSGQPTTQREERRDERPTFVSPPVSPRPTVQATANNRGEEQDFLALMQGVLGGNAPVGAGATVKRTAQTPQAATPSAQRPVPQGQGEPVRERKIVVKVNGMANPFTDPVAATAFAHSQTRAGRTAELYEDGQLKQRFEPNSPPN